MNGDSSQQIQQLIERMNHLEQQISDQNNVIDSLSAENQDLKNDMQSQKRKMVNMQLRYDSKIVELEKVFMIGFKHADDNQNANNHHQFEKQREVHKIQGLESKVNALEEEYHREAMKQNTFISFCAFPTEDRVYAEGEILIFDNDVVNLGQGYIPENSTFVCPYSAYYLFTVTVMQQESTIMRAYLMLEGSNLHSVRADDTHSHHQATIVVVTLCEEGQRVWVEANGPDSEYHLYASSFSTISGTLLRVV